MNRRYRLLFIFVCCFIVKASAQQLNLSGVVYKKNSPNRLAQVLVTNLRSKELRLSDDLGMFQIPAAIGDTLLFKKIDYSSFYFVVYGALGVNIYMQQNILLQEVSIKEQTKKQEINDIMNLYKTHGGYYTLKPSVWSLMNSPVTGLYELFGKEPNEARRFQKHTQEELDHIEVIKKYTNSLIKKVTGMTDDNEVKSFTDVFTPSVHDIREWNDYELIEYIKRSYTYFQNNKNRPKLPKLY